MDGKFVLIVLIVLIAATAALLVSLIYTQIIFENNKLYCKHYLRKDWDMWEKVIEKLKEQKGTIYVSKFDDEPKLNSFHFDIEIGSEKYTLIYWAKTGFVSVHQGTDCTLCGYDKYHSDIAAEIMKERIKNAFDSADEETKRTVEELMGEW